MTDCEHRLELEEIVETGRNLRTAHVVCKDCGFQRAILTTRTEVEIRAEAEAEAAASG
jgi:ribosomal protein L32